MPGADYPAWGPREAMLWAIYEWCVNRPPGEDALWADQVATLFRKDEYIDPTRAHDPETDVETLANMKVQFERINLFLTLVRREGLIDADIHKPIGGLNFVNATVRGLTEAGLQRIQEIRDPNRELMARLDDLAGAIRGLEGVSDERKDAAEQALGEVKDLARQVAAAAAVRLLEVWLKARDL